MAWHYSLCKIVFRTLQPLVCVFVRQSIFYLPLCSVRSVQTSVSTIAERWLLIHLELQCPAQVKAAHRVFSSWQNIQIMFLWRELFKCKLYWRSIRGVGERVVCKFPLRSRRCGLLKENAAPRGERGENSGNWIVGRWFFIYCKCKKDAWVQNRNRNDGLFCATDICYCLRH